MDFHFTIKEIMVKNNIEVDVKVKCIEQGKTQVQIAESVQSCPLQFRIY